MEKTSTFVFKEVAHARSASKDKLCYVLNYLSLRLRWKSRKPFRKPYFAYSVCPGSGVNMSILLSVDNVPDLASIPEGCS